MEYSTDNLIIERFPVNQWTPDFGTIRTKQGNYYVATILDNGKLVFEDIEAQTLNFSHAAVTAWYESVIRMPNRK